MKFITNFTKSILIISLISASMCLNLLRRKSKTKDDLNLTLPSEFEGTTAETKKRANNQVEAARALLTFPGTEADRILKTAASHLSHQWLSKDIIDVEIHDPKHNFNRSINGGIWNGEKKGDAGENIRMQISNLAKVANDAYNPKPTERAGVIAILGDIGTAVFDCPDLDTNNAKIEKNKEDLKTEKNEEKIVNLNEEIKKLEEELPKLKAYCKIANSFAKHFAIQYTRFLAMGKEAKDKRGGSVIAPRKKDGPNGKERGNKKDGDKLRLKPRSGLLSNGKDESGFSASWPWQMIPEKYLTNCKEPWAGHYSGSIVEILFMLDMFTRTDKRIGKDEPLRSFNETGTMLYNPYRKCKAALAAAFLISIGYHSAIEVKPTIWMYLGKEKPKIFTNKSPVGYCDTEATKDIVKLMKGCTTLPQTKNPKKKSF